MVKNNQRGFTLIEMLIAISIFSFIAIASYYSLSNFNKSSVNLQKKMQQINNLQELMIFLDRDFSQVYDQKIILSKRVLTISSLQDGSVIEIKYRFGDTKIIREVYNEGGKKDGSLLLLDNLSKMKVRLLNNKNKWLTKWGGSTTKYIKAIEITFDSVFGEIKKLVMIDE